MISSCSTKEQTRMTNSTCHVQNHSGREIYGLLSGVIYSGGPMIMWQKAVKILQVWEDMVVCSKRRKLTYGILTPGNCFWFCTLCRVVV